MNKSYKKGELFIALSETKNPLEFSKVGLVLDTHSTLISSGDDEIFYRLSIDVHGLLSVSTYEMTVAKKTFYCDSSISYVLVGDKKGWLPYWSMRKMEQER